MKIIVAGGREFDDYNLVCEKLDLFFQELDKTKIEIVSGCASGADTLAIQYANERGYKLTKFPADWKTYGRAAGPIRNLQMAKYGEALVAFWDGKSRGTQNMITKALEHNLKIRIVNYGQENLEEENQTQTQ